MNYKSCSCIFAAMLLLLAFSFGCNKEKENSEDAFPASTVASASQIISESTTVTSPTASSALSDTSDQAASPNPDFNTDPSMTDSPVPTADETAVPSPSPYLEPLEVPVYNIDELLFDLGWSFGVVDDYCHSSWHLDTEYFYSLAPTDAQRQRNADQLYFIYETEEGYRFYMFFDGNYISSNDEKHCVGFPVYVKELHSFSEFSSLNNGDSIDKVAEIDPIAGRLRDKEAAFGTTPQAAHGSAEHGWPITSFHYLSDGVLKIEYDMTEEGELYIINMIYSEDYKLASGNGWVVDYYIYPIALPQP